MTKNWGGFTNEPPPRFVRRDCDGDWILVLPGDSMSKYGWPEESNDDVISSVIAERDRLLALLDSQQRTIEGLRKDAERLDYIEQLASADKILPLVVDWTYEGKRYPTGIREAIDAALSQSSQAGEGK